MAKSDVDRLTDEKVAKGGVLVKFYFDMQSPERDKLQPLMVNLINEHLLKEKGVVYCFGSVEEPLERQGVFVTSGIVTVLFESFQPLLSIVLRYAPVGIEVLRPEREVQIKTGEAQSMLMDVSQIAVDYSKFILEKLKPEEVEAIRKQMDNRAEVGKQFLDKKDEKKGK